MKQKLHFQRFEFKYILNIEQYKKIKQFLQNYIELDKIIDKKKSDFYEVISLYYDSPRFFYYWEKIDGASRRKKIRLRTYRMDNQYTQNIFFEIKRKRDAIIFKDRLSLSSEDYNSFILNGNLSNKTGSLNSKRTIEEYKYEKNLRFLEPKLLVTYNREPYLGKFNKSVRVTFDYHIRAKYDSFDLFDIKGNNVDVSGSNIIMEIKFKGALPFYLERIIKEYNLSRVPYSKYCHGIEANYSLSSLHTLGNGSQSEDLFFKRNKLLI